MIRNYLVTNYLVKKYVIKKYLIIVVLMVIQFGFFSKFICASDKYIEITPHEMANLVSGVSTVVNDTAENKRINFEQAIKQQEKERQMLAKKRDQRVVGDAEFEEQRKTIDGRIKRLEEQRAQFERRHEALDGNVNKVLMSSWQTALETHKEEHQRKTQVALAGVTKAIENEGSLERLKYTMQSDVLLRTGTFLSLTGITLTVGYYGTQFIYKKLALPTLIKESSVKSWGIKSWGDQLYTYFFEEPEKDLSFFNDIIFPKSLDIQLRSFAQSSKESREKGLPYRHMMLYGPPGVGKTMFARKYAAYTGMDYAIIPGGNLAQFDKDGSTGQSIVELNNLFAWAKQSPHGVILYFDEAEAFLRDRKKLTNGEIKLLDTFLEETGTSSDNYQVIIATNLYEELDSAVRSRFPKKIYFPLPGPQECKKMMAVYYDTYIKKDRRMIGRGDDRHEAQISMADDINDAFFDELVQKMDHWSGREIEQLFDELRAQAYQADHCFLTKELFNHVFNEKLDQHKQDAKL